MRSHFVVLACILVLATLLVAVSVSGLIPQAIMQNQARNSGVVGFISFVGLCLVVGARQAVAAAMPPMLPAPRLDDPASAAARQALYEILREIGLPSDQ